MSTLLAMMGVRGPRGDAIFRPEDGGLSHVFIVPPGVFSVCAVLIASGGNWNPGGSGTLAGAGGNLRWMNDLAVTPGERLHLRFSLTGSGNTSAPTSMRRDNGSGNPGSLIFDTSSIITGDVGGGDRGWGGYSPSPNNRSVGGGGAGGYGGAGPFSGYGGNGYGYEGPASGGIGGAGGGGNSGYRGGSTYIYGEGASGGIGSPGVDGSIVAGKTGRVWGGGGGGGGVGSEAGVKGIARILWGAGRAFPSTAVSTSTD